ncbi:hypothetical protein BJX70DRAFT_367424 [Aspergillus crustosus]
MPGAVHCTAQRRRTLQNADPSAGVRTFFPHSCYLVGFGVGGGVLLRRLVSRQCASSSVCKLVSVHGIWSLGTRLDWPLTEGRGQTGESRLGTERNQGGSMGMHAASENLGTRYPFQGTADRVYIYRHLMHPAAPARGRVMQCITAGRIMLSSGVGDLRWSIFGASNLIRLRHSVSLRDIRMPTRVDRSINMIEGVACTIHFKVNCWWQVEALLELKMLV